MYCDEINNFLSKSFSKNLITLAIKFFVVNLIVLSLFNGVIIAFNNSQKFLRPSLKLLIFIFKVSLSFKILSLKLIFLLAINSLKYGIKELKYFSNKLLSSSIK